MGVLQIVAAIRLRKEIEGEFWLGLAGALSIALAVLILVSPGAGALSLIWIIAGFAVLYGITLLMLGIKVKKLHQAVAAPAR